MRRDLSFWAFFIVVAVTAYGFLPIGAKQEKAPPSVYETLQSPPAPWLTRYKDASIEDSIIVFNIAKLRQDIAIQGIRLRILEGKLATEPNDPNGAQK